MSDTPSPSSTEAEARELPIVTQADLAAWSRIDQAIGEEAVRLCRQFCLDEPCGHSCRRDQAWRTDAFRSLRARATLPSDRAPVGEEVEELRKALDSVLNSCGARGRFRRREFAAAVERAETLLAALKSPPLRGSEP